MKPQVLRGRQGREGSERTTCSSHFFVKFVTFYVKVVYSCDTKCTMVQMTIQSRLYMQYVQSWNPSYLLVGYAICDTRQMRQAKKGSDTNKTKCDTQKSDI